MASFIQSDLTARIRGGAVGPDELTLEAIAKRYEVSLTPVRSAIAELVKKRILAKDSNNRLRIPKTRQTKTAIPAPTPDSPVDLFAQVEDYFVRLSLRGQELFVREEATAQRFDVSRSQMRNIFSRLAGDGLLEHVPRRGWKLRPFRKEDLDAFSEVRIMLETGALKLAKHRLVEEDLRRMLDGNVVPTNDDQAVLLDNTLHGYIIEKSQNPYVADFFERKGRYYDLLSEWERGDRAEAVASVRWHRKILEALIARDWDAAEAALAGHIRQSHQKLCETDLDALTKKIRVMDGI